MKRLEPKTRKNILDFLMIIVGGTLMALAINFFYTPHHIVPGGLTGIAMMLNYKLPVFPIGTTVLLLNIPLFIIGWRVLGPGFLARTLIGTLSSSLLIDLFSFFPVPECEPLAAAVFGGALAGLGMGVVFSKGATTGGTDLLARLIKVANPSTQMGVLMMLVDGIVVVASIFVFGSLNNAFYAVAALYVASKLTDLLLYGSNTQWTVYIMSEHYAQINTQIQHRLGRGTTLLHGEGGYQGSPRKVILCAVKRRQIASVKAMIKGVDPNAFIIVNKSYEVFGEGFGVYDEDGV